MLDKGTHVLKHIEKGTYMYSQNKGKVIFTNTTYLAEKFNSKEEANNNRISEEWEAERYGS